MKHRRMLVASLSGLVLVGGALLLTTSFASAGSLTGFDLTPSTTLADATATYTFTYTNATQIPANPGNVFRADFPNDFDMRNVTAAVKVDGATQTIANFGNGNTMQISLTSVVPAGSTIQVILSGMINPGNLGVNNINNIMTTDTGGNSIDILASSAAITITLAPVSFAGGTGSSGDPYQITNCSMLQGMYLHLDAHYKLMGNIDCSDSANWNGTKGFNPVGYDSDPFTGSLDGNGFQISDLTILRADNNPSYTAGMDEYYVGLFGYTQNATLTNVAVVNSKVQGYHEVGGLAGYMDGGTITGSSFNLGMADNSCAPGHCVWARYGQDGGGLVGYMASGTITHSQTSGPVKGSGNIIGGVVGQMTGGTVEYTTSSSNMDGGTKIGGLVGYLVNGTLLGDNASGNTDANTSEDFKSGEFSGGLVGYMADGSIDQSMASGYPHAETSDAGGFVGEMDAGTITNSYAMGTAHTEGVQAGGFIGFFSGGSIDSSYAAGSATASNSEAGGFAGFIEGNNTTSITNSFARTIVTAPTEAGGFAGYIDGGSSLTLTHNYFDQAASTQDHCAGGASVTVDPAGCTAVNVAGSQEHYFTTATNAPFKQGSTQIWNLSDWTIGSDQLPFLLASPPIMLCEETAVTTTSANGTCFSQPDSWGTDTWEARYKQAGSTNYTAITLADIHQGHTIVTGLTPGTDYMLQFRFTNTYGTSQWGTLEFTTLTGTDADNDGVADSVENAGPNNGDANNDGIQDSQQSNVASFVNSITGKAVAVQLANGCTFTDSAMRQEAQLANQDGGFNYPNGLVAFTANCGTAGFTTAVKVFYYDVTSSGFSLRKFNSRTNTFAGIAGSSLGQTTVGGHTVTVASYSVTDGGVLDEDGQANGVIVDPSGLATVAPAPSGQLADTGQSSQMILFMSACILIAGSLFVARTKRQFHLTR